MTLGATPSQTVGPYFKIGLGRLCCSDLAPAGTLGERITIEGHVLDANGDAVPDAILEIWQADSNGRYFSAENCAAAATFSGFGRIPTDDLGRFRFVTVKPGRITETDGTQHAPHINVAVFMRGLLRQLNTRIYFADVSANVLDPILRLVPAERRNTLIATPSAPGSSTLIWNIILQGEPETVFFDW